MKKRLIVIVGPTAIGKTSLAIGLAKHLHTEIISADSRQFFKEMRIGTAVPTAVELGEAKHHFIQNRSITADYSVGSYEKDALELIDQLFLKHDDLLVVGGSGLYVDAITKGLDYFPNIPPEIKNRVHSDFEKHGIEFLQNKLKELDPNYFNSVDLDNPMRLIRALEVCLTEGRPYSSYLNKKVADRNFQITYIGIEAPREIIYQRIELRVDHMIKEGLLEEAKSLLPYKELNALNTVGYKELFAYFNGETSLEEAVSEIKKNTRRFAKRQGTWFRKNQDIHWVSWDNALQQAIQLID